MSSYASSLQNDDDSEPTLSGQHPLSTDQEKAEFSDRMPTTKDQRRPGGGTLLRPAGRAHDWYSGGRITSHGRWFRDTQSRTLLLRGVNLCGNSKLPTTPNGSSHLNEGFFDHRNVCFLGRPFPRDQADEHFSRLKSWGMTFVRLLVPWEALEHSGP
ncbi:hypothetical protein BGZ93_010415 [Podila epicladia]|nr:hypothetical protein BGZ93_010415 [Podila epicladia]